MCEFLRNFNKRSKTYGYGKKEKNSSIILNDNLLSDIKNDLNIYIFE